MTETKNQSFWDELNIRMLDGEELLYTGTPKRSALFKSGILESLLMAVFTCGVMALFLPIQFFVASRKAKLHQHYLTNRRVIIVNGVLGYTIQSIPLNRISDVTIECTWVDRILDIRTIQVKDLASQQVNLLAIERPVQVQEQLLEQVRRVATENELDAAPSSTVATKDPEMIRLLREIRDLLSKRGDDAPEDRQ